MIATREQTIHVGDAKEWLESLPAASANCAVTSPPYWGLRDYGAEGQLGLESTPTAYIEQMIGVLGELRRVLRPDGVLWLNIGDSYAANRSYQVADSKWRDVGNEMSASTPDGLAPGDLVGIPWSLAFALRETGWRIRSEVVWCLSGGVKLYAKTQNGVGPAMLKDLVRLRPDTVALWNGERWTRVTHWTPAVSRDGAIEVEFRSGERVGCTVGHLWPTQRGLLTAADLRVGDIIPDCQLPGDEAHGLPSGLSPDTGEVVGLFLAEGSSSGSTMQFSLSVNERHLYERIQAFARFYDEPVGYHVYGNTMAVRVEGTVAQAVIRRFVTGRTSKEKRLSPAAWRYGNRFLRGILAGYLWGDGGEDEKNTRWRLGFTQNDALAADLRCLAARLGAKISLRRARHKLGDRYYPGYRGELRWEPHKHPNAKPMGEVVAIRRSRARKFWDVTVADAPHLFALASGLLTHNSKPNPMPESVNGWRWERHKVRVGNHGRATERQRQQTGQQDHDGRNFQPDTIWQPCPGCEKCAANDGLVLRRGSWRPTSAHEKVFMLTGPGVYFGDAEAVREAADTIPHSPGRKPEGRNAMVNGHRGGWGEFDEPERLWAQSGGRNLRNVWAITTAPMSWEMCKACKRVYSGAEFRRLPVHSDNGRDHRICQGRIKEAGYEGWICGQFDSWLSHFATFPPALVEPCIRSTCPERVCVECGEPWARVVEYGEKISGDGRPNPYETGWDKGSVVGERTTAGNMIRQKRPLGLRPTCSCGADWQAGLVIDPFAGSGTTLLVAEWEGRRGAGCDLNRDYVILATERIRRESRPSEAEAERVGQMGLWN